MSRCWFREEFKVQGHKVGLTNSYQLTSLSFHVDWPSHSWDIISKCDLKHPNSRSWVGSMFKVTKWVQHPIDSHPFRSMSISPYIPEMRLFKKLAFKIQGQRHVWGPVQCHSRSNKLSTHIPFTPCQLALPFLRYGYFKYWASKS